MPRFVKVKDLNDPGLQPAVARGAVVELRARPAPGLETELLVQAWLVLLDGEDVVRLLVLDQVAGVGALDVRGVGGDDTGQVVGGEQGSDLRLRILRRASEDVRGARLGGVAAVADQPALQFRHPRGQPRVLFLQLGTPLDQRRILLTQQPDQRDALQSHQDRLGHLPQGLPGLAAWDAVRRKPHERPEEVPPHRLRYGGLHRRRALILRHQGHDRGGGPHGRECPRQIADQRRLGAYRELQLA